MRKFIILISLVSLLTCCALSASAYSFDEENYLYAPISFDLIEFDYPHDAFVFPLNSIYCDVADFVEEENFRFTFADDERYSGIVWSFKEYNRYGLDSQFVIPYGDFSLYASNNFVQLDYLYGSKYYFDFYSTGNEGEVIIDSVNVKYKLFYYVFEESTGIYEPTFTEVEFTSYYGNISRYLMSDFVNEVKARLPVALRDDTVINIQDLTIHFDLNYEPYVINGPYENFPTEVQLSWLGSTLGQANDFGIFSYQNYPMYSELGSKENQASFLTFFTDTVGGFMNVELFPGFSFGTIFYFILIIGVVLWFIKIVK